MARAERIGLAVALAGHALLFGVLSLGWLNAPELPMPLQQPIDVSLVKNVALEATAPVVAPPAPSVAPEQGPPEDAAPPPEASEPEPAPSKPVPPKPAPEPKPQPAVPKPEPKPAVKPKPQTPAPKAEPVKAKPQPKPVKAEAKPASSKAPSKSTPSKSASTKASPPKAVAAAAPAKAKPAAATGKGNDPAAKAARPHGSRLGADFLKGLADTPAKPSPAVAAPAAKVGAQQAANIASAILRQVQPCANRQVTPGPGAERIRVTINLRLNRDGSLAARPRITAHDGVDDENQRYLARVDDLAIATFVGCAPLQGLPDSLYDVQNGWSNFTMRYKLPG